MRIDSPTERKRVRSKGSPRTFYGISDRNKSSRTGCAGGTVTVNYLDKRLIVKSSSCGPCGIEQEYRRIRDAKRPKIGQNPVNRPGIGWGKTQNPMLRGSSNDLRAEGVEST